MVNLRQWRGIINKHGATIKRWQTFWRVESVILRIINYDNQKHGLQKNGKTTNTSFLKQEYFTILKISYLRFAKSSFFMGLKPCTCVYKLFIFSFTPLHARRILLWALFRFSQSRSKGRFHVEIDSNKFSNNPFVCFPTTQIAFQTLCVSSFTC